MIRPHAKSLEVWGEAVVCAPQNRFEVAVQSNDDDIRQLQIRLETDGTVYISCNPLDHPHYHRAVEMSYDDFFAKIAATFFVDAWDNKLIAPPRS